MYRTAREVYEDKVARLRAGDAAVRAQVGEGRDITSVLREFQGSPHSLV